MQKNVSTYKIATAYIGTVVGAGFASGQELLQFFVVFGYKGILGLVLVTGLFMYYGYKIMACGKLLNAESHESIIQYACGKVLGTFLDLVITFFLFGSLTAMIAGSGALMNQLFKLPEIWGDLLMVIITIATVITGIKGVINSISFIVPFLLISTIAIGIAALFSSPVSPESIKVVSSQAGPLMQNWWWSAILYASYNILLSIAILGPLGAHSENQKSLKKGAILGGFGLGIGAFAIFLAVFKNALGVLNMEIPMIYIANLLSPKIQLIYSIVLIAEIYSTAIGSLYGFVVRINKKESQKNFTILAIGLLALLASQLGFSTLVKYFYPIIGYSGIALMISIPFAKIKFKKA